MVSANVRLPGRHREIALVGLDEPWTGAPDADRAFRGAEDAACRLVLCHSPDGLPRIAGRGASLYLCGHTQGGQVALPWGPIIAPGPVGKHLHAGFHDA